MKTIGIISDTHGTLDSRAYAALADCDYIIHAGDIGRPGILHELETIAPVYAVLGNNDFAEYGEAVGRIAKPEIEGVRFLVSHYPNGLRFTMLGNPAYAPGEPLPQVCIHGHTHVPELVTGKAASPALVMLCPGAVFRPRSCYPRSIARMTVDAGLVLNVEIKDLDDNILMSWCA